MRPSKAISIIMCLVFVLTICVPAYAVGPEPAIYYGTVQSTEGTPIPAGTVKAYIEGNLMGSRDFSSGSYGELNVQGEPSQLAGKEVTFRVVVNGFEYDAVSDPDPVIWESVFNIPDDELPYFTVNLTVDVDVDPPSNNADLNGLTLSSGTLSPAFSAGIANYTASVANSVTNITITPTAADPGASIKVNGTSVNSGSPSQSIPLNVGQNTITVLVTAENNVTTKTYIIVVTRVADQSAVQASLAEAGNKTAGVSFNLSITNAKDLNGVLLTGNKGVSVTSDKDGQVFNGPVSFTGGAATVPVTLNTTGNHTLSVTVEGVTAPASVPVSVVATQSNNANLKSLSVTPGTLTPAFAPGTLAYTVSVANSVTSVSVNAALDDTKASMTINGTPQASGVSKNISLNVGSNNISIVVTAEDGTTKKTYQITVNRAEALSNNANLSGLALSKGTLSPAFGSGTTSYTAQVGYSVSSVTITPTVADPNATIKVNGSAVNSGSASQPITLNVGTNPVSILVTAQDGTTKITYTVSITRVADLSGVTPVIAAGDKTKGVAFSLSLTNAKDVDGIALAGNKAVTVTSDRDGQVFSVPVSFSAGSAAASITLNATGSHVLTVTVAGVTPHPTITVNVVNPPPISNNAYLSSLAISPGALDQPFAQDKYDYTAKVPYSVGSVTITPTAAGLGAIIKAGTDITKLALVQSGTQSAPINLKATQTVIYISVTSQDGENTKWYSITVNKVSDPSIASVKLTVSGEKTAGVPFDLTISGAVNTSGSSLSGNVNVKVTSNRDNEVFNGAVAFTAGSATVPVTLATIGGHTLTVTIAGVTPTPTVYVSVKAAPVCNSRLSSLTLSQGTLDKNFDPDITEYIVHVPNAVNSITVIPVAFDPDATIKVNGEDVISGQSSSPINIKTTEPSSNLVIIEIAVTCSNGSGTMVYTYTVYRNADESGAQIALQQPGNKVSGVQFAINISEAKGATGNSIVGNTNVCVISNVEGEVFDGAVDFTAGAASVPVTLATVGQHLLTVEIAGVTNDTVPASLTVNVVDQSGAKVALAEPGDKTTGVQFAIDISEAKGAEGNSIEGNVNVKVTSDRDGELYNAVAEFTEGASSVPVILTFVGEHILTVEIAGVTNATDPAGLTVNVVDLDDDQSGAKIALAVPGDKTTEVQFGVNISEAKDASGNSIEGNVNVKVTSDLDGVLYDAAAQFTEGAASVPVTLNTVGDHTLTVEITGVSNKTDPVDLAVKVVEATPVQPDEIQFSSSTYSVGEDSANATITVKRSNGSKKTVSVDYATSNGTAAAGSDYTAASGTLTFASGVITQTFSVEITNDTVKENNETINLILSNPQNGARLGSPVSAVLTITDNDTASPGGGGGGGGGGGVSPLEVDKYEPVKDAAEVALDASVKVTFKQEIKANDLSKVSITDGKGNKVSGVKASIDGKTLALAHDSFKYDTLYKVKIEKGAVEREDNSDDNSDISWSFTTMKEPVVTPEQVFSDLPPTHWAFDIINSLFEAKIVGGYPDGTFGPENSVTRAEFSKMLTNALGLADGNPAIPTFSDVKPGDWYFGCVEAAVKADLVKGYDTGEFRPDSLITRQEMTVILVRAMGLLEAANASAGSGTAFIDDSAIASWSRGFVVTSSREGLVGGYPDNTFRAEANATRAEACAMIYKLLEKKK